MALVDKETVNAKLFKVDDRILALGVIKLFELCHNRLAGFHELFDGKLLPVGRLHLINTTLDVVKLTHELLFLPFNAHRYLSNWLCPMMTAS